MAMKKVCKDLSAQFYTNSKGKTNVRVSNGKNVPCDNLQLLTMTGAFPDVWGHNI